jgi:hypothetical protein
VLGVLGSGFLGIDYSSIVARYLRFRIEFLDDALLPSWKGNLLRGSIGSVLPRICGSERFDCSRCSLWTKCPYGYLFRARSKGIVLRKIIHISKPLVLKPPLTLRREFRRGDQLVFSAVLFGDSIVFEKDLIESILRLGERGIGYRGRRGRFRVLEITVLNPYRGIESILYRDNVLYDSNTYILFKDIVDKAAEIMGYDGFTIKFLTPYRIVSHGRSIPILSLETLIKYASRRFTNITAQYLYKIPRYNIHEVLEEARRVRAVMIMYEKKTFKYRGKPEQYYTGEIMFEGKISKTIATILAFTELAHVGKRASYGHGWYKIQTLNQ